MNIYKSLNEIINYIEEPIKSEQFKFVLENIKHKYFDIMTRTLNLSSGRFDLAYAARASAIGSAAIRHQRPDRQDIPV